MPHAALWVVQLALATLAGINYVVSMPHAALWVVQRESTEIALPYLKVSMPHAALWVVQPRNSMESFTSFQRFNAARGFVGGAAAIGRFNGLDMECFNAARGFVGGAASSLSALVPLRGKSPFGKSPEI